MAKEPDLRALLTAATRLRAVNLNGSRMLEPSREFQGLNPTADLLDVGVLHIAEILFLLREIAYAGPISVHVRS